MSKQTSERVRGAHIEGCASPEKLQCKIVKLQAGNIGPFNSRLINGSITSHGQISWETWLRFIIPHCT